MTSTCCAAMVSGERSSSNALLPLLHRLGVVPFAVSCGLAAGDRAGDAVRGNVSVRRGQNRLICFQWETGRRGHEHGEKIESEIGAT